MKRRKVWLVVAIVSVITALIWWLRSRPPAKVVPVGTITLSKPVANYWVSKQGNRKSLILVTEDGQSWRVKIRGSKLVHEPTQITNAVGVRLGFFDMDKDGYPEFFWFDYDWARGMGYSLWVFKRKEILKKGEVKQLSVCPQFPFLARSKWVLWARIPMPGGHASVLTFVTEQNPKHPRKVVIWDREGSHGGLPYLLSQDERRLISFNSGKWQGRDFWKGVESVEDLDHDGVNEIIAWGRSYDRTSPGHIGIYKWDGRTYRLWWTSNPRGEYVIWAKLCDLDGDGTKEIVAVLDLKGMSDLRALAVYRLEGGSYRKIAQYRLPKEKHISDPYLCEVVTTKEGSTIILERDEQLLLFLYHQNKLRQVGVTKWWGCHTKMVSVGSKEIFASAPFSTLPKWLGKLISFLPASVQVWAIKTFEREREKTKVLTLKGKELKVSQFWLGELAENGIGKIGDKIWALVAVKLSEEPSLYRYRLLFGVNGRYRVIWQREFPGSPDYACSANLDGDGYDEVVFVDSDSGKVEVFKVVPK